MSDLFNWATANATSACHSRASLWRVWFAQIILISGDSDKAIAQPNGKTVLPQPAPNQPGSEPESSIRPP